MVRVLLSYALARPFKPSDCIEAAKNVGNLRIEPKYFLSMFSNSVHVLSISISLTLFFFDKALNAQNVMRHFAMKRNFQNQVSRLRLCSQQLQVEEVCH